ncbi:MAG: Ig-like domain-containing protein [bacterium]
MNNALTHRIALAATLAIVIGCANDNSVRPTDDALSAPDSANRSAVDNPATVAILPSPVPSLSLGGSAQLSALVTSSTGVTLTRFTTWASSNSAVASVSTKGFVTALSAGTAVISATVTNWSTGQPVTGVATVTVQAPAPLSSISVAIGSTSVAVATTTQATATPLDALGQAIPGVAVTWTSTSPSVATVNPVTGVISAVAAGVSTITATSGTVTGSAPLTVTPPVAVNSITVSLGATTIGTSASTLASAILKDLLGQVLTGRTVTWSSTTPSVATVNAATGQVTGIAAGTSVITATSGGVTGSATITITTAPPPPANEVHATLPQVYLNTTAPTAPAAGGVILSVASGGNLQAALGAAKPGDVIELANGATFIGNFTLPNKNTTSTNWIVIRPASMTGVPQEGSRMTPSLAAAARLPLVVSPNNQGAFNTASGAHHYRLIGLEVSVPATVASTGLIRLGTGYETTLAALPHDLVLDRMYIHGTATGALRRAVVFNAAASALIDSYVSECHEHGSDSQALGGWNGSGPFKIVNNYLEAASENIMFGGADPVIPGLIPSDIEIRHNHITKQLGWKGQSWVIKNLLELKNAQRVLVEGNLFENNWRDAQGGSAINLKSVNQDGTCPWCITRDITLRLNLIRNTGSGFNLSGYDVQPLGNPAPLERVTIMDNIMDGIDLQPQFDGDGRGVQVNSTPIDAVLAHNTILEPTNMAIAFGGPAQTPPTRFGFRDNVIGGGQYGVKGPGLNLPSTFATYMPTGRFAGNVLIAASSSGYPAGNYFPVSRAAIGLVSATDLHLGPASIYRGKATDGLDPGANVSAVYAAITGVIVP